MSSLLSLSSADRAAFAVTSRLLSCLITESILKAVFVPIDSPNTIGACIVLSKRASDADLSLKEPYCPSDIFVVIFLRSVPILKNRGDATIEKEIGLMDPLDMLPWIYELDLPSTILSGLPFSHHNLTTQHTTLSLSLDPLHLWNKFSAESQLIPENKDAVSQELHSSFEWQKHAYETCPTRPTLNSSSLEWEQSLVEGHPTHPMHRARRTIYPLPMIHPGQYDYYQPHVRFVSIPRSSLLIQGDFEELLAPLQDSAAKNAGKPLEIPANHMLFPVHELQIPNIVSKFPDAVVISDEFSVLAPAQASIRTLTLPCSPHITLKLAVSIKISSALRTISHFTAYSGPKFGRDIVPRLAIDNRVLITENEVASAVYKHDDPEVSKHCTAILREVYSGESRGEKVIVAAALAEIGHDDGVGEQPVVVTVFGLDSAEKKFEFLERYVNLIFDAFIPPLLINGIAFEAHGQNTLARFDEVTGQLNGFVFRDFGGVRIHVPTLLESTGVLLDTLPNHCIVVDDVHDAYKRLYHTLIHNHLHRLIRVLGFHHNGRGWELVKSALEARVPEGSGLWDAWLNPKRETVMGKCLLRMKLEGLYREAVYGKVPNLIHFRPQCL
ncbi:IucC family-domain-containing protein [Hysterangium stoloniferum]|nr:IucC family-domain-containing protein [Hysterangium stoloniferum]